jgi:predicted nucleic acid-binding protein
MIAVDTNILVYAHREDSPWVRVHGVRRHVQPIEIT